jgi:ParB family transcriptional regulator, chromosome partitioning protein
MPLAMVSVSLVIEGTRLRPADDNQVEALMASIQDVGILNPITVYERQVIVDRIAEPGYGLVAGLHRLTAAKRLGMKEIPANIVTLGELERQIAECDENLAGPRLTPSERALFTRRRKDAYEALHPETRNVTERGGPGRGNKTSANLADVLPYSADQAKRTGQSERVVQRDAERGEKIAEDVMAMIAGTKLDSGAYMDSIKNLSAIEQKSKVRRDLDDHQQRTDREEKSKRDADAAIEAAEWIVDAIGKENVPALLAALESVSVSKLCAEIRRAIHSK